MCALHLLHKVNRSNRLIVNGIPMSVMCHWEFLDKYTSLVFFSSFLFIKELDQRMMD